MEYKAVTELEMFCLDFHKQYILLSQKKNWIFFLHKNEDQCLYEISLNLFHTKRGLIFFALYISTNFIAIANNYEIQYNYEIYATKFIIILYNYQKHWKVYFECHACTVYVK